MGKAATAKVEIAGHFDSAQWPVFPEAERSRSRREPKGAEASAFRGGHFDLVVELAETKALSKEAKIFFDKFVYHKPRAQEEEPVSGLFSKWTSAIGNEKLKTDMKSNVLLTAEKTIYYFFTAKVQQIVGAH